MNGQRHLIAASYDVQRSPGFFQIGRIRSVKQLIIDPILVYSTFLAGPALRMATLSRLILRKRFT